jgi:hypothetical protein
LVAVPSVLSGEHGVLSVAAIVPVPWNPTARQWSPARRASITGIVACTTSLPTLGLTTFPFSSLQGTGRVRARVSAPSSMRAVPVAPSVLVTARSQGSVTQALPSIVRSAE